MSGYTAPFFLEKFTDNAGNALSGGQLYFYVAGSTTIQKNVYSDISLTLPLTQPLVLDASGTVQQYFMEAGQYKILLKSSVGSLISTRDHVEGGGNGGLGTPYIVKTTAGDVDADYLENKFADSSTVTWSTIANSGVVSMVANVDLINVLDYRVKAKSSDTVPGYLIDKIADTSTISLSIDSYNQLNADINDTTLVRSTGATFTGPVTFQAPITAANISSSGTILASTVSADNLAGANVNVTNINSSFIDTASLQVDNLGNATPSVVTSDISGILHAVPGLPFTVAYNGSDTIPGYLGTKLKAGTGITINTTTDGVNGTVMHVNSNNSQNSPIILGKFIEGDAAPFTSTPTTMLPDNSTVVGDRAPKTGSFVIPGGYAQAGDIYRTTLDAQLSNKVSTFGFKATGLGAGVNINVPLDFGVNGTISSVHIEFEVKVMPIVGGVATPAYVIAEYRAYFNYAPYNLQVMHVVASYSIDLTQDWTIDVMGSSATGGGCTYMIKLEKV